MQNITLTHLTYNISIYLPISSFQLEHLISHNPIQSISNQPNMLFTPLYSRGTVVHSWSPVKRSHSLWPHSLIQVSHANRGKSSCEVGRKAGMGSIVAITDMFWGGKFLLWMNATEHVFWYTNMEIYYLQSCFNNDLFSSCNHLWDHSAFV